ncbi:GNVR domain-containing protein [Robbsia sp. KACC 23696]|uniref:GumC family protein n=1 Tax=Robbsia sp. KACC 23696 TaxID=3149231 RepID=UPI00325AC276
MISNHSPAELFEKRPTHFIDIILLVGRHKKPLFAGAVVGCVLGIATAYSLPKRYTASAVILPPQPEKTALSGLDALGDGLDLSGALGAKNSNGMFIGLLQSNTLQNLVSKENNLKSYFNANNDQDVSKILEKNVEISTDKKTGFILISVKDRSPAIAATLANSYVKELQVMLGTVAMTDAQQRHVFYENEIKKNQAKLSLDQSQLDSAMRNSGFVSLEGQVTSVIRDTATLQAKIADGEVQLSSLNTYATDENPDVIKLKAKINALKRQLSQLETGNDDVQKSGGDLSAISTGRLVREIKYDESVIDQMRKQLEIAKIDEAKQGAFVQQIDMAVPPIRATSPQKMLVISIALLIGSTLGLVFSLFKTSFSDSEDFREKIGSLRKAWSWK